MRRNKTHSLVDRIVSIHQPQVRPIVRGKEKSKVELGSKINVSLVEVMRSLIIFHGMRITRADT
jgi:IS5 family transposase